MKSNILIIVLLLQVIIIQSQVIESNGVNILELSDQSFTHRINASSGGWARHFRLGGNDSGTGVYGAYGAFGSLADNRINYLYLDATGNPEYSNLKQLRVYPNGNVIVREGNLGIGVSSASYPLNVQHPVYSITENGTNYKMITSLNNYYSYNIPSGMTDTGYRMGLNISTMINDYSVLSGTLKSQYGIRVQYGSYNAPQSTGTVENAYGLFVQGLDSGATNIINKYGIYQTGSEFKNYFEGNIGIGTTTPSEKLEVSSGQTDGTNPPVLRISSKDINAENNQLLGEIQFYNEDLDGKHVSSFIKSIATEVYGRKGVLSFGTTGVNSTDAVEKMRIDENGNVGIGTDTPLAKLDVDGESIFRTPISGGIAMHIRMPNETNSMTLRGYNDRGEIHLQNSRDFVLKDTQHNILIHGKNGGNIGVGTDTPTQKLDVNGSLKYDEKLFISEDKGFLWSNVGNTELQANSNSTGLSLKTTVNTPITFTTNGASERMRIQGNGNVGIGTEIPDEKLTVKGKIHTEEVIVDLSIPGPDYVFEKYFTGESKLNPEYKMPTLKEVEAYTKANNHLPEVPSAQEMQDNGIQLKEMNLKLLQKIEELTIYTIEQQKEIESQNEELKSQKNKNIALESRLDKIETLLKTTED